MRTILAAALLATTTLAGCVTVTFAQPPANQDKLTEQMFVPSVQIDKNCSGTVIYSDRDKQSGDVSTVVLTAKHCVNGIDQRVDINLAEYDTSLRMVSETSYKARVIGTSHKSDLALIKLADKDTIFTAASLAAKDTELHFGEDTFSVSFPNARTKTFTRGTLGFIEVDRRFGNYGISDSLEFSRSTADIQPGSSGSALFHVGAGGDYEIIGVLTGYTPPVSFMNSYTPLDEIHAYIDVARKSYEVNKEPKAAGASR